MGGVKADVAARRGSNGGQDAIGFACEKAGAPRNGAGFEEWRTPQEIGGTPQEPPDGRHCLPLFAAVYMELVWVSMDQMYRR